jgi:hypothetical protein
MTEPQCPEALYNPDTDTLRRCVLGPHGGLNLGVWHEAEDGIQWRIPDTEPKEGPEWTPPF